MGFMNVSIVGSDMASDFAHGLGSLMAKAMVKELREKNSAWNTDGDSHVAMVFEEVILPAGNIFLFNEDLRAVAKKTLKSLKGPGWFGRKDRNTELDKDYRRLVKSLEKFIKEGS